MKRAAVKRQATIGMAVMGMVWGVGFALIGCEGKETPSPSETSSEAEGLGDDGSAAKAPDEGRAAPVQPDAAQPAPAQPDAVIQDVKAQAEKAAQDATAKVEEAAQEVKQEVKQEVEQKVEQVSAEAKTMMTGYLDSAQALISSIASVDGALSAASKSTRIKGLLETVNSYAAQFDALAPGVQDQLKEMFAGRLAPLKTQLADQMSRLQGSGTFAGLATMLKDVTLP